MLTACSCFKRMCKHYEGILESDNPKRDGKHVCKAFPNGIPEDIVTGKNEHSAIVPLQNNNEIYERARSYAEMELYKSKRGSF